MIPVEENEVESGSLNIFEYKNISGWRSIPRRGAEPNTEMPYIFNSAFRKIVQQCSTELHQIFILSIQIHLKKTLVKMVVLKFADFLLRPSDAWKLRYYVPLKCQEPITQWHGSISQTDSSTALLKAPMFVTRDIISVHLGLPFTWVEIPKMWSTNVPCIYTFFGGQQTFLSDLPPAPTYIPSKMRYEDLAAVDHI